MIPRLTFHLHLYLATRPHEIAPRWGYYHHRPSEHSSGGIGLSLPFLHIGLHYGKRA